jgi:branched-chain amino acid transport system ATP-binding protein
MLKVDQLEVSYGNIKAIKGISLEVNQGEIVTLIGSNGAGKSTTLRAISGLLKPRSGSITFQGDRIDGKEGHEIVARGICQSPEGRRIFPRMSVSENLDLGAFLRNDKEAVAADRERVLELFPRLAERINQKAGTMSGGEQQMLAVGRALMGSPTLLLLDEPSIIKIKEQGTTILLVEQNALAALNVADRAYVLESGNIKLSGNAKDLISDPAVTKAYLGG